MASLLGDQKGRQGMAGSPAIKGNKTESIPSLKETLCNGRNFKFLPEIYKLGNLIDHQIIYILEEFTLSGDGPVELKWSPSIMKKYNSK